MEAKNAAAKLCTACGRERKMNTLLYDPKTLEGYCKSPYICDEREHPNGPVKLMDRGRELTLLPYEQAADQHVTYLQNLTGNTELAAMVRSLMSRPVTFRIVDVDQARLVAELALQVGSQAEALRMCIDSKLKSYPAEKAREELARNTVPLEPEKPAQVVAADESGWEF